LSGGQQELLKNFKTLPAKANLDFEAVKKEMIEGMDKIIRIYDLTSERIDVIAALKSKKTNKKLREKLSKREEKISAELLRLQKSFSHLKNEQSDETQKVVDSLQEVQKWCSYLENHGLFPTLGGSLPVAPIPEKDSETLSPEMLQQLQALQQASLQPVQQYVLSSLTPVLNSFAEELGLFAPPKEDKNKNNGSRSKPRKGLGSS
jgi:hypothetical protein